MATKEIIEVGSSDDEEAEPPPKKRKPVPNAMVHIPSRLPGVSIKPAKKSTSNSLEINPLKVFSTNNTSQKVAVPNYTAKSNIFINPLVNKLKNNSVTVRKSNILGNTVVSLKDQFKSKHLMKKISHAAINPTNLNINMSNVQIKKVQPQAPKQAGKSVLSTLPSSITVKKASSVSLQKSIHLPSMSIIKKSMLQNNSKLSKPIPPVDEIVDLDDEEAAEQQSSTFNPQWYMRPEDSQHVDQNTGDENSEDVNFEEQNNKEPESHKYVEITIEDSPVKPAERHFNEIGKELPVIIEDSPCKNKGDGEDKSKYHKEIVDPPSRKKLNYPNEQQSVRQIVEIEIDPIDTTNILTESKISEDHQNGPNKNETEEISENRLENESSSIKEELEQEFHPIYSKFIETCFEIENSDDMKKIVEKKIKAYYRQCPKDYVESEEFIDMVSSKTASIKAGPDKMYLYIKDVVDELNMQRKLAKTQEANKEVVSKVPEECPDLVEEHNEYDTKRARQIRKLEKTIKQLHKAIQKLEEQEVDLDDEENSMYLLTERYKERLVRVHAKFRQMTNTKMPSEPRIVIEARPGCPLGPAKKLEKFINKKVPIGAPLPFPDFHDVLRCIREANEEDKLGWSNMEIEAEARDLFERCGKKLKRRRQENEWRISVVSRIPTDVQDKDPAEDNIELKQKLSENKLVAAKRESEILNKYADKQHQLKLEAEEIEDKEEEESAGESEEEEDLHLANKENRKELLKRLIKERNKKNCQNAETSPEDSANNILSPNTPAQSNNVSVSSADENNLKSETQRIQPDVMDVNNDKETDNDIIDIDSDVDELHLLQKLRFEDEIITSSSDSDSTIAISDSLESESDGDNDKIVYSDIISIENSSYSESEALPDEVDGLSNVAIEVCSNKEKSIKAENIEEAKLKENQTSSKTNDEDSIENILLASSEEDATSEKDMTLEENETCANLKDDVLSITDTVIEEEATDSIKGIDKLSKIEVNVNREVNETCINLKDDVLLLSETVIGKVSNTDTNEDVDKLSDVDENKINVLYKETTEEILLTNGDCNKPKDMNAQLSLNDNNVATNEIANNSKKEENTNDIKLSEEGKT